MASLLRDGGLLAYSAAALLGAPYFLRRKWRMLRKGRSDCEFDLARWTIDFGAKANGDNANADNANGDNANGDAATTGPRVAFVLASWGELVTMEPLIRALRRERPRMRLLISVERPEIIAQARALADEVVVPFPFDSPWPVARWQARVRPDLVVFFEQFEFPTLTGSLRMQRVPFVIVQARVNASRGLGYQRRTAHPKFKRWQLRGVRAMLVASQWQGDLIAPVLSDQAQLKVVGSLKFPIERPQIAPQRDADLRAWIEAATGGAPLLLAGSTHPNEEAFILDALQIVREKYRGAAPALLLAPRGLQRADEVAELLSERGLRFSRRSQWQSVESSATGNAAKSAAERQDVLLLDTMGELGVAYGYGVAALVGGTINGSSHNIAEPLVWGVPVAYGPMRGHFESEQVLCENAGVGFRIETPAELAAHWLSLLESSELRDDLASKAQKVGRRATRCLRAHAASFG